MDADEFRALARSGCWMRLSLAISVEPSGRPALAGSRPESIVPGCVFSARVADSGRLGLA
jgi:hypothetical protein